MSLGAGFDTYLCVKFLICSILLVISFTTIFALDIYYVVYYYNMYNLNTSNSGLLINTTYYNCKSPDVISKHFVSYIDCISMYNYGLFLIIFNSVMIVVVPTLFSILLCKKKCIQIIFMKLL